MQRLRQLESSLRKSLPLQESKKTRKKATCRIKRATEEDARIEKVLSGEHQRTYMTAEMNDGSRLCEVQFEAETSADVTTITVSLYYDRFSDLPLTRSNIGDPQFRQQENWDHGDIRIRDPDVWKHPPAQNQSRFG